MRSLVPLLLLVLAILHQDFWWWNSIHPLVFGFIPIGLAYQVGISIVAAMLWALAVKYCWPNSLELDEFMEPTAQVDSQASKKGRG